MALSLSVRNPNKVSILLQPSIYSKSHLIAAFDFHGELYSSAESHVLGGGGQKRRRPGGGEVRLPCGCSLSLSRLHHSSPYRTVYSPYCQVSFLLPHPSSLAPVQEKLPLKAQERVFSFRKFLLLPSRGDMLDLGHRGFSSLPGTDSGSEDESDVNGEDRGEKVQSIADPDEVEKVCKVIDELFALDRNMEAVLDECGVNLSHDLVVEVLNRFRHARKPALRFFFWAGDQPGFTHDSRTYNSIMNILAKTRQFETMISMLEEMGAKKLLTMETFTIAMKAFAAAKERKKAVGIFELMKKYKFKVGVDTINFLLDSLGKAKLGKEAEALFEKLKNRFTPNLTTYVILLNGWCRVKNLMEAGRVWNDMVDKGFKPDIVAHNTMLQGLLKSRKRSEAIKLFEVMKAKGPSPNLLSYTIMIRDFCKQSKMEEAVEYFGEMLDAGYKPDAAVYTCLITGFGNQKRLDTVYKLLKEMQEKGCPPDGRTYNALIKLMASQRKPEDATKIYKKMIHDGIEPSIHTYNMIMKSFVRTRNYEMSQEIWKEMMRKGFCPDDNSYTVLIGGLISEGRCGEACKHLEEMLEKGMKAPQLDYNKFVADFCRAGKPDILEELARKMKFSGKFEVSNVFARCAEMLKRRVRGRDPIKPDGQCA